jgi:general secretion pathway protein B
MSYILEALKKSQQERELGHVPKLEAVTFDEPVEQQPGHRWVVPAVLLALVAVGVAGYAILREARPPAASSAPVASGGAGVPLPPAPEPPAQSASTPQLTESAATDVGAVAAAQPGAAADAYPSDPVTAARLPSPPPELAQPLPPEPSPAPYADELEGQGTAASGAPLGLQEPGSLSDEPQVLVVPAPSRAGEPLPRGAEELRRAVLGSEGPASVGPAAPYEPPVSVDRRPAAVSRELPAPVPPDLIADIEAFKKGVGGTDDEPPARKPPAAPAPATVVGEDLELPAPPSYALRLKLPEYSMPVHVYDSNPGRRFVYINGRKVKEQETSREGLLLERVVADGAILRYEGERFFQPR